MRTSPNISWKIRKANEGDFLAIKQLEHQCFSTDAYDDELLWQLLDEDSGFTTWVALDPFSKEIVGYVSVYVDDNDGTVVSICVSRAHQRKRVGTTLLQKTIDFAKKSHLQRLFLTVSVKNHAAIKLYRKMGFSDIGLIPNYYSNGDAARIMALTIKKHPRGD